MTAIARCLLAAVALAGVAGCGGKEDGQPPPVRPVLSAVARPAVESQAAFAGIVQPRFQTERGFQVLGRLVTRNVDVGDIVRAGQKLAQIDPLPYQLAVRSSDAELFKARSKLENSTGAETRSRTLLDKKVVSQADFETAEQGRESAAASVQQAEANLAKAREELGYTTLTADIDGVVTSTDVEVGQTVSPGEKVMTLARTDLRDAVVDLPDDLAGQLRPGASFDIQLQADLSVLCGGVVREIAPEADATTRTRRVKITLDNAPDPFRLGATITARPTAKAAGRPVLEVPASAVLDRDGAKRVWIVDPKAGTVGTVAVEVAGSDGDRARIVGGLEPGARVVVAGIHSLSEGQAVRIDAGAAE